MIFTSSDDSSSWKSKLYGEQRNVHPRRGVLPFKILDRLCHSSNLHSAESTTVTVALSN
jgi:hypothetical protein